MSLSLIVADLLLLRIRVQYACHLEAEMGRLQRLFACLYICDV